MWYLVIITFRRLLERNVTVHENHVKHRSANDRVHIRALLRALAREKDKLIPVQLVFYIGVDTAMLLLFNLSVHNTNWTKFASSL